MTSATSYPLSGVIRAHADRATNDALLSRLDEAKRRHPESSPRAELLRDPEIRDLVYDLLAANEAWINHQVKKHQRGRDFQEMKSRALSGEGESVNGAIGAILQYDYRRKMDDGEEVGARAFTPYLAQAVHHALVPKGKELREMELAALAGDEADKHQEKREWRDRHQREPREVAIDDELLAKLDEAIEALPERNRNCARFIVDTIRETGERPTDSEIGASQNPAVTKQMGNILGRQSIARLVEKLEEMNPQLAEDGIGGWEEMKRAFGIHKHAVAGRD